MAEDALKGVSLYTHMGAKCHPNHMWLLLTR